MNSLITTRPWANIFPKGKRKTINRIQKNFPGFKGLDYENNILFSKINLKGFSGRF